MAHGRYTSCAGALNDRFLRLEQHQNGAGYLLLADGDDLVDILANDREGVLARSSDGDAVGDRRARNRHDLSGFDTRLQAGEILSLGGDLMVLAVQRGGENLPMGPAPLAAGDHLLLQGTWAALDKHLADPQMIVVDTPEAVRRQAVPLGHRAREAIAILVVLVVLLSTGRMRVPAF